MERPERFENEDDDSEQHHPRKSDRPDILIVSLEIARDESEQCDEREVTNTKMLLSGHPIRLPLDTDEQPARQSHQKLPPDSEKMMIHTILP